MTVEVLRRFVDERGVDTVVFRHAGGEGRMAAFGMSDEEVAADLERSEARALRDKSIRDELRARYGDDYEAFRRDHGLGPNWLDKMQGGLPYPEDGPPAWP